MGNSVVKKLNGYLLTKKIKHRGIVEVRPFATAKGSCMQDHVKPIIRDINPQQIILHVGTNDLKTKRTASQIAESIIDLSISLKKNGNMVAVSGIVPRLDELNNKAAEVNNRLELMCKQRDLPYISHCETIYPNRHLNESNLHLNSYGIRAFAENFSNFCPSLIDINLGSTQKIMNQIRKNLCYAYQICMEQVTHLPGP